jgi:hypothetical protein
LAQFDHPRPNPTTVNLNLGFTGTTRTHTRALPTDLTTSLAGHRITPTTKAGKQVVELREFDLGFTFAGLGVLSKDVEDDRGAVDDFDLDGIFERAALARRELGVGNNSVRSNSCDDLVKFLDLAAPEVGGGIRVGLSLKHAIKNNRTSRFAQRREFLHRIFGVFLVPLRIDTNENNVLNAQLSILNLSNVLELGSEPVHAPERDAVGEVHLPNSWGIDVINFVCHVLSGYATKHFKKIRFGERKTELSVP